MANDRKVVLPNGLRIVTEKMPSVRSICIGIWLCAGSRHEDEEVNGITHFLEHMVFKGTKNRSAEDIARAADSIGGHLDAFTAKECTSFSIKVLDIHLDRAFDILTDLVKNPLFLEEHIASESKVIQEEIKMVEDTPDDLVHEIFIQNYWRGHALGRPILGTRSTVGGLNRDRIIEYYGAHYTPNNILIAAAGNLEHDNILDLVTKAFGEQPRGPVVDPGPVPVAHPMIRIRHKKNLEQVHICVGAPAYPQVHEKRFASYVLNNVFGGGMSSRLFQNIREKRGLVYAIFSGMNTYHDTGCFNIYAGTSTENARKVIDLIAQEIFEMKAHPISQEELKRAKEYSKGNLLLSLESSASRMSNQARQEMYFGRSFSLEEIERSLEAVTVEQVLDVARELFDRDKIAVTVLGPEMDFKLSRTELAC